MKQAVIFYFTESEVLPDSECNKSSSQTFMLNPSIRIYDTMQQAFDAYANTHCQHSELIHAETEHELEDKIQESLKNHQNPEWCKEYFESL